MNEPTAFKQYSVTELPTDPSQITYHTLTNGALTCKYYKVGNLYFGFFQATFSNSAADQMVNGNSASYNQIATALGITINTVYTRSTSGSPAEIGWNGSAWVSGVATSVLDAILAN